MSEELAFDVKEGRRRFLDAARDIRPDLHRYAARMTGSVTDGEDIVQETLARAYFALPELETIPPLRPWLFRIAHNAACNHLQRYERRMSDPLDSVEKTAAAEALDAEGAIAREEAVGTAIGRFIELAPSQRSALILKDVLGHSLEEIAAMANLSVPAVKAALHRGRAHLRKLSAGGPVPSKSRRTSSSAVVRYALLFNARDWDGVRAMLLDDAKLDVVDKSKAEGRRSVGQYFTNYGKRSDWHLVPAWLDGREVLAVYGVPRAARPAYFIEVQIEGDRVSLIRDFRYVPYIAHDAAMDVCDE